MKKTHNPDESVRKEQFGAEESASETSELLNEEAGADKLPDTGNFPENEGSIESADTTAPEAEDESVKTSPVTSGETLSEVPDSEADPAEELTIAEVQINAEDDTDQVSETEATTGTDNESEVVTGSEAGTDNESEVVTGIEAETDNESAVVTGSEAETDSVSEAEVLTVTDKESDTEAESATEGEKVTAEKEPEAEDMYKDITLPLVDYTSFSKHDLTETLGLIVENRPVNEIRDDVERIRIQFYKKHKAEVEEQRAKFIGAGGNADEFKPAFDEDEKKIREHLEKYREKRSDQNRVQEAEKQENLRKKYEIIEKIKDLVNREESINKTFQEFRNLQNEWHSTGVVPQSSLKDLWENYHHNVEIFYDYIKINKELRDLDLKKNLEAKIVLCEKTEELLMEPSAVNAFRILQEYHNHWREIGPVPHESKNDIWERFKEATAKINKRHHEFFETQKDSQRKNLEAKIALCEKVEEINLQEIKAFRDFEGMSDEIVKLQKMWRTIGFAPKKYNNKIYQRFREACDAFFEKKRAFYSENKESQLENLQKKTELCIQAESFAESTEWKATTDALIKLQKEWKEVGPVPRKQSEKIWKRFRKACDTFFERKSSHFSEVDTSYEDNLNAKKAIIEELENFDNELNVKDAFEKLKDIQRRWTEIGYVPFNVKEEINLSYKNALNVQFDRLKLDDEDKNILKYKNKLDSVKANPKLARKVRGEREKFYTRIRQLESDITLWENNVGFFAKSKNAESMISEVKAKIEDAKKTIRLLEEKVKMIDHTGLDE
jgi:hypothetical protein